MIDLKAPEDTTHNPYSGHSSDGEIVDTKQNDCAINVAEDEVHAVLLDERTNECKGETSDNSTVQASPNVDLRVQKTIALYICFCALGLAASLLGSTLVHMEIIFGTTTKTMAFTFTGHSIGYTIGAWICGVVYDKTNKELGFSVATIVQAVAVICASFMGNLYAFMFAMAVEGFAQGFLDAASQSYCVGLWYNSRLKEPLFQAAHAFWSLGAAAGPLLIQQFLEELNHQNNTTSLYPISPSFSHLSTLSETTPNVFNLERVIRSINGDLVGDSIVTQPFDSGLLSNNATAISSTLASDFSQYSSSTPQYDMMGIKRAKYAYLLIGLLMLVSAVPFIILYLYRCAPAILPSNKNRSKHVPDSVLASEPGTNHRQKRVFTVLLLILLFIFYYLYLYIENIPSAYFPTFVLKELSWSVKSSTTLVSLFFAFHCTGRFLAIPLSALMRPRTMVAVNILLVALAYVLLLFVSYFDKIMWLAAGMAGIGMASTFAAMVLWTSESIEITGRVASVMLIGSSIGGATGPALVGLLMDLYGAIWMVYILVIAGLLHIVNFILFVFFFRWRRNTICSPAE